MGFPGGSVVKSLPANAVDKREEGLISRSGRFPWRRKWQPNAIFLPGNGTEESGYSLWGRKELDITELLSTQTHTYTATHGCTWK